MGNELLLNLQRVSVCREDKVLEMNNGDGYTTT